MKEYSSKNIRNVALVSHSGSGKTVLTEAFLHFTGATTRMGKIEEGNTISDFDEEEVRRTISLYSTVIPVEYKDTKINLLDTPGYTDFVGEMISALSVADSAMIVVDSVSGFEVGTEIAWNYCNKFELPRFVIINKMDRENADYKKALDSIQTNSETRLLPIQLPIGEKQDFKGVIDLLSMKAFKVGAKTGEEIPADLKAEAEDARTAVVEAAAEGDDSLLEKYLEGGELTGDEIARGLAAVVQSGSFIPVLVAAGNAEIGIAPLLDSIVQLMPSPLQAKPVTAQGKAGDEVLKADDGGPIALYVWKTTADPYVGKQTYFRIFSGSLSSDTRLWNPIKEIEERFGGLYIPRGKEAISVSAIHSGDIGIVPKLSETATGNTLCDKAHPLTLPTPEYPNSLYQVAINPKTQADSTKISPALTRLCEEDMTLSWHQEPSTHQTILQGMGDQHIDVVIRRAETKLQVSLTTELPRVPYRETITKKAQAMHRHKKQSGGSGQFGEVWLRIEPIEGDFEFVNAVFGGAIGNNYMPAIEKGIRNVMKEGILAGFPVSGIKVEVYDGKEHPVDSKPIAFESAGREAFKLAVKDAGPVLLEPIMNVKVIVPEENMGDILGDMNSRRARVQGMDTDKGHSTVSAKVPKAEMLRYTTDLRSLTGGRGIFEMELDHYEVVPAHVAQGVIDARQKELASKKEE
ncbi:elongation factor G [Pelolinea submarina]|uniref:Elongation factor G n=1 Tax=Pelolinea submarina TaxID=913107 RepID=A0A347ZV80_9CHLR|nr:elongation factor G [Pelolinea submarina]REG10203.1 elongation factor G [Pelolinea submarina]BBB49211.1 elongation factor G [Pelolinea submarina]